MKDYYMEGNKIFLQCQARAQAEDPERIFVRGQRRILTEPPSEAWGLGQYLLGNHRASLDNLDPSRVRLYIRPF